MTRLAVDVRVAFGEFDLDLSHLFEFDRITALFGPSGGGKSTFLRIIAGLESQAQGCVRFGDETWLDSEARAFVPPHRRGVGYVFQDVRLFPHLSVGGNLHYAERRSREARSDIDLAGVVAALDLDDLLPRSPSTLSGGERQRVAMARTLLTRPRLLLMDEPLAALDAKRKSEILPYIERLPNTFGVPVIYVTHSIDEVVRLAERIVVLTNGRKTAAGAVADVLARLDLQPGIGRFEAGVALTTRILSHDTEFGLTRLDHHGQTIEMPIADLKVGEEIKIRVRARDVSLALERPKGISMRNILPGRIVEIVEEPGTAFAETLVDIGGARLRSRITRAAVADLSLSPGIQVFALIKSVSFDRRSIGGARVRNRPDAANIRI